MHSEFGAPYSQARAWRLCFEPDVILTDPAGKRVSLSVKKAAGLLGLLDSAGEEGLSTSVLQSRLWPDKPKRQSATNLRQTIHRIRRAVGPDALLTRDGRIQLNIPLVVDRQARQPHAATLGKQTPVRSFLNVATWLSDQSPNRAVDLLRSNYDLALQISGRDLKPLARRLVEALPCGLEGAWARHFLAMAGFQSEPYRVGARRLAEAISRGVAEGDKDLVALSALFLCALHVTYGRLGEARQTAIRLGQVLGLSAGTRYKPHLKMTEASVLIRLGNVTGGLTAMDECVDEFGQDAGNRIQAEMELAFMSACAGDLEKSEAALRNPIDAAEPGDFTRLDFTIAMTRLAQRVRAGEFEAAATFASTLTRSLDTTLSYQFSILAREDWAVAAWELGEKETARAVWGEAVQLRKKLDYRQMPWDAQRFRAFDTPFFPPGKAS